MRSFTENLNLLYNPNKRELQKAFNEAQVGRLKGIILPNGDVYLADAYYLMHEQIWEKAKVKEYFIGSFELSIFDDTIIYSGHIDHLNKRLPFLKDFDIDFPENIDLLQKAKEEGG